MRVYVVVEGQTEESLVRDVLVKHFTARGIYLYPIIVRTSPGHRGGGRRWNRWKNDIGILLRQQRGPRVRVTTLFDLFRLPQNFPGLEVHGHDGDTDHRCDVLQQAMAEVFDDRRFIPYLQRHELEALVLASINALYDLFDAQDDLRGLEQLEREIAGQAPEDINDGADTAPSKRLERYLPSYSKVLHGPRAIEVTGLQAVRDRCPRFNHWISTLEALA